jgi:PiT family inorganic phosphate transporter
MGNTTLILFILIMLAFLFALTNGLHDASSVVATLISGGAASPRQAIVLASVLGLAGAVFGGNEVADTVSGIIDLPTQTALLWVLLAAILGATIWNLITWKSGLPSSSTHALIGGIIGAVRVSSGPEHIIWGFGELLGPTHQLTGIMKVIIFLLISPLIGFILAFFLEKTSHILLKNAEFGVNRHLKRLQWIMSGALSFNHGANDTQKIIGLIMLALASANNTTVDTAPLWVRVGGGSVMFLGTMLGGWSIMKTIGRRIYKLKALDCFNAQLTAALSVFGANLAGAPVSTTHVVVGSVVGVGAAEQIKRIHWGVTKEILISWVITIPLAATVSGLIYAIINSFGLTA